MQLSHIQNNFLKNTLSELTFFLFGAICWNYSRCKVVEFPTSEFNKYSSTKDLLDQLLKSIKKDVFKVLMRIRKSVSSLVIFTYSR